MISSLSHSSTIHLQPSTPPHFLSLPSLEKPHLSLSTTSPHLHFLSLKLKCHSNNTNHYPLDIDLVQTKEGIFVPKQTKVVVLWDLDNKPPRGPPYDVAMSLKTLAANFGELVDVSAYANRHAFTHLPTWVLQERRERRRLDVLERKGIVTPQNPYVCSICGRKCKTNLDLKKHFKQLHERERQKKLSRLKQLKGKKRQRFKERYLDKNDKYEEGVRGLFVPRIGYGLAKELRRAGVFVKTVEDKPQAADWALKRQMIHSMSRGIDWLVLVSDDSDFRDMVRRAREEGRVGTVVVGDTNGVLGRSADLWVEWGGVESGKVSEEDLRVKRGSEDGSGWGGEEGFVREDGLFSVSEIDEDFEGGSELDEIVDEVVVKSLGGSNGGRGRFSAFSEGEDEEDEEWFDDDDDDDEFDFEGELEAWNT